MTKAEATLSQFEAKLKMDCGPDELREIYDIVAKLERVCEVYSSSAQVAMMIVSLKIGIGRGQ